MIFRIWFQLLKTHIYYLVKVWKELFAKHRWRSPKRKICNRNVCLEIILSYFNLTQNKSKKNASKFFFEVNKSKLSYWFNFFFCPPSFLCKERVSILANTKKFSVISVSYDCVFLNLQTEINSYLLFCCFDNLITLTKSIKCISFHKN